MRVLAMVVAGSFVAAGGGAAQAVRFVAISAGLMHTCALDEEGQAWCWGLNDGGQLGTPVSETCAQDEGQPVPCSRRPVRVPTEARFVQLTAGEWHTCALTREGDAWCWGLASSELLGTDSLPAPPDSGQLLSSTPGHPPVRAAAGTRFLTLSLGTFHTCGLTTDTLVVCWGRNEVGQLGSDSLMGWCQRGDGQALACRGTPVAVNAGAALVAVEASFRHTCALDAAGALYCWGQWVPREAGEMAAESRRPMRIDSLMALHALDCGQSLSVALSQDGLPFEWGWDFHESLNEYTAARTPFSPLSENPEKARQSAPLLVSVVAGGMHRCGLTAEGVAYCWGHNERGQLGTGKGKDVPLEDRGRWNPGPVAGGLAFRLLTAGGSHTCGLTADGSAYCWGLNRNGQLGIGTKDTSRREPTRVAAPAQP